MKKAIESLHYCARHGRLILIAGLAIGILFPPLSQFLKQWLGLLVGLLLFAAALRIGYRDTLGKLADLSRSLPLILVFQVATPLAILSVFFVTGFHGALATAIILSATASSISGSANLTIMTGNNPAAALGLLIAGTALLPVTTIPVFLLLPQLGSISAVVMASGRLLVIIATATGLAFWVRYMFLPQLDEKHLKSIDGVSSILMAILVIGLMSAVTPAIKHQPATFATTLVIAFVVNYGLQLLAWLSLKGFVPATDRAACAIVAGNRNSALFIAALPAHVMEPLLLYIGCYQIPMYLTPLVLGKLYKRR